MQTVPVFYPKNGSGLQSFLKAVLLILSGVLMMSRIIIHGGVTAQIQELKTLVGVSIIIWSVIH